MGTVDPGADARAAESALAGLREMKIDPSFRPRIPIDISPAQFVADLKDSLDVIRDYARLRSETLPALARAVAAKDSKTIERLHDEIRQKRGQWRYTLAGRQEGTLLDRLLDEQGGQLPPASAR